jgi:hypothetical protein
VDDNVWRVQLRLPPVYCVNIHLGDYLAEELVVENVGWLEEVRCPPSAYQPQPAPDIQLQIGGPGDERGTVQLTALGPGRTRVELNVNVDAAWIQRGHCDQFRGPSERTLERFWSFRSVTVVPVSLRALLASPHVVEVDAGGAHGGDPIGCAEIDR